MGAGSFAADERFQQRVGLVQADWRTTVGDTLARPYKKLPSGERVDDIGGRIFIGIPAGDTFATCPDLDRFAQALLDHTFLNPAYTELTLSGKVPMGPPPPESPPPGGTRPQAIFQAYGSIAFLNDNRWSVGHGGGSPGASTEIKLFSESHWVSVVLSNYDMGTVLPLSALTRTLITQQPTP